MNKQEIENRINAEYQKHKNLDWAKITANKLFKAYEDQEQVIKQMAADNVALKIENDMLKDSYHEIVNDAVCGVNRVKTPHSNACAKFVIEWLKENK